MLSCYFAEVWPLEASRFLASRDGDFVFCSMRTIDPRVLNFDSDSFSGCDDFAAQAS